MTPEEEMYLFIGTLIFIIIVIGFCIYKTITINTKINRLFNELRQAEIVIQYELLGMGNINQIVAAQANPQDKLLDDVEKEN